MEQGHTTNVMADGIYNLKSIILNLGRFVGTIYVDDVKIYRGR